MPKIQNMHLANKLAGISTEMVQFDGDGIGEINSTELHAELLTLAGFFPVEEPKVVEIALEDKVDSKAKKTIKK